MHEVIKLYHLYHVQVWTFLVGSGIVSAVLQVIKHYTEELTPREVTFLLGAVSFGTAALHFLASHASQNPNVLAVQSFVLMGGSQPVYRLIVEPAYKQLLEVKASRASRAQVPTAAELPPFSA